MSMKYKVTFKEKVKAVRKYLSGLGSQRSMAAKFGVTKTAFQGWINRYETFGAKGLKPPLKSTHYSYKVKVAAVASYLNGDGSLNYVCKKYKIHSSKTLQRWIWKYNNNIKLKYPKSGGGITMTKGRKTTYQERIEIVGFCISHEYNYLETANKYKVSYQQVYSWTKKYNSDGESALDFHCGRKSVKNKNISELTEDQIIKAKIKLLEAENERLQMENDILKKFQELEGRRS